MYNLEISNNNSKSGQYLQILPQIEAIIAHELELIANLANTTAVLRQVFGWFWVGFYLVKGDELVLGPFQGTLACTRIPYGKGVCGTAWKLKETIVVSDVEAFPGHIACSSESKSEIVVPIMINGAVVAVLDVDSDKLADFDSIDKQGLEQIAAILARYWA